MRLLTLAALLSSAVVTTARADVITLRADEWCPYNCDPESDAPGYMIEIAKAALEPRGHKIEYALLNWARAITESRDGKYTGIVGAAVTDAEDFVFPKNSLGLSKNCFFVQKDTTWTFKGLKSLEGVTLGAIRDYSYDDEIDEYIKTNARVGKRIDYVSGDNPLELNVKKMALGRITTFIEDEYVMANFRMQKELGLDTKTAGCVKETPLFVAFGPKEAKAKEYAAAISDKVAAMRKDGSLAKLLAKYGVEDWVKPVTATTKKKPKKT